MTAQGKRHRWPGGKPPPPHPGDPGKLDDLVNVVGDLAPALRSLAPNVLATETRVLDANGQATAQYRVPFAAVCVLSASSNQLLITAGPPAAAAPGPGPSSGFVPQLGFAAHNISGNAWTIYGGNPGDLVTVSTFGRPVPPVAESGLVLTQTVAAASLHGGPGGVTAPGAGATIANTNTVPAGLYSVQWQIQLSGTVAAGDLNNMQLQLGASIIGNGVIQAAVGGPFPMPTVTARSTGSGQFKVVAVGAGTAAAVYSANIVATQIGP